MNDTDNLASDATQVPRIVYESSMARLELAHGKHAEHLRDIIREQWYSIILLILLLVGTNLVWIIHESQYVDEVTETVTTSTDGGGNAYGSIVSGNNSEVNYGEGDSNQDENSHS